MSDEEWESASDGGEEYEEEDDVRSVEDEEDEGDAGSYEEGEASDGSEESEEEDDLKGLKKPANKEVDAFKKGKKKKANAKTGGFQSMGLSYPVYKAIIRKGYQVPTPIQRKSIPLLLVGKDVVAMARTGSGKTAAFVIPMLEKLKAHSAKVGIRALIMTPTRELAMQTNKFIRELGKFTDLRTSLILGGDNMDSQFADLHSNPDIVVATPGRFLHLVVEMDLSLQTVEYMCFDEADRLFELGFKEQLEEILERLPQSRQTVLFSATLPKMLVDFAKAGLQDPTLIRLDVETKLSTALLNSYYMVRRDDKLPALLYILRNVIKPHQQTVIFVATKHHVEYLREVLRLAQIDCTYSYGSLDQTARKINVAKFRAGKTKVLIVTDVAARGIDIPLLDCVINFDFPPKPKLFVHRVGRVARAGRSGTAYSLVSPDEMAYLVDLHLFLGRPIKLATPASTKEEDSLIGPFPQNVLDISSEECQRLHAMYPDLYDLLRTVANAYKLYDRSRPVASTQSNKRAKEIERAYVPPHPDLTAFLAETDRARENILEKLSTFKAKETIFEAVNKRTKHASLTIMSAKRQHDDALIQRSKQRAQIGTMPSHIDKEASVARQSLEEATEEDFEGFSTLKKGPSTRARDEDEEDGDSGTPAKKKGKKDKGKSSTTLSTISTEASEGVYIPYRPADGDTERGLSLGTSNFHQDAETVSFGIDGDDDKALFSGMKQIRKWDRKKKKYVNVGGGADNKRIITTESGVRLPASFKSERYSDWVNKSKIDRISSGVEEDSRTTARFKGKLDAKRKFLHHQTKEPETRPGAKGGKGGKGGKTPTPRSELQSKEKILKERKHKEKMAQVQSKRRAKKARLSRKGGRK